MYAQLDKIPNAGDTIEFEGLTLAVLTTKGRRITKIRVIRNEPAEQSKTDLKLLPAPVENTKNSYSHNNHDEDARDTHEKPPEEPSRYEYRGA